MAQRQALDVFRSLLSCLSEDRLVGVRLPAAEERALFPPEKEWTSSATLCLGLQVVATLRK